MDGALNVAIILTGHAYLPEAWAYHRHLAARGWSARVVDDPESARGVDLAIAFSLTQQRALQRLGVPAVHEYHSLSAGRWPPCEGCGQAAGGTARCRKDLL